jgi:hypothetical protein
MWPDEYDEAGGDPAGLEDPGVIFLDPGENRDGGVGVRLKVSR